MDDIGVPDAFSYVESDGQDLREAFNLFVRPNEVDVISAEDLGKVMRILDLNPSDQELIDIFDEYHIDAHGSIHFEEFYVMMMKKMNDTDTEEEIRAAFSVFDSDGKGFITHADLRHVIHSLGQSMTDEEIDDMVWVADKDGNGEICIDEFMELMRK